MKTIIFFNNKGGVGKTTLIYHFTQMLGELGHKVLAADLDPQANLTSMFLDDNRLFEIFNSETRPTILEAIKPLTKGIGDIKPVNIERITDNLMLIPGDLELSVFEDRLSDNWNKCVNKDEAAFRIVSAFYRIIQNTGNQINADYIVIDVGPNLGAINRSTLIAADYLIIPMAADLFSLQGLRNMGTAIERWKEEWKDRLDKNPEKKLNLPKANIKPLGYVIMQHGVKESRPVKAYLKWAERIPNEFRNYILKSDEINSLSINEDNYCIALIKHYHSLMAMAMEAKKPIFSLKPSDGAIGAHYNAVTKVYSDFKNLTNEIIGRCL